MKICSKLQPLAFHVECKSSRPFFETIAQFDCRPAAEGYVATCSTVNPAFTYRITEPFPEIWGASLTERMIVGKLVTDLLAAGLKVSVWNGGDDPELADSTDAATIFAAMAASDQDELTMDNSEGYAGWIRLVWGNDCDIISDYSTRLEAVMAAANALAEELGQ